MSFARKLCILLCVVLGAASSNAQNWEQEMELRVEKLIAKHGTGKDEHLKRRLNEMAKRDQAVRKPEYTGDRIQRQLVKEQERVDTELTAELKTIVQTKGWPTIRLVGLQASEHAALILTHSRDHDFQRALLPRLQELADADEILISGVAFVVDKVLVSEGKPQRFGTQFVWKDAVPEMMLVEDAERLDLRRAKYMLPPIEEYKRILLGQYRVQVR